MSNHSSNQGLVLSADAKPRLKWTEHLHDRFVDAVAQLGGADKATPKSVMQVMGIPGLTLYHLKSHLQKYRLAKSRDTDVLHDYREGEIQYKILERSTPDADENRAQNQLDETMLQMQIQVQRKLQEQIEVQRHLQLRIEAQGKYLQNVLRKAQETLSAYSSNSIGTDVVKAELSELASAVENECLNSPSPQPRLIFNISQQSDCSIDSSLTSSERPDKATEKSRRIGSSSSSCNGSEELQSRGINYDSREAIGTKRSRSSICGEATLDEHTTWPRIFHQKECSFEETVILYPRPKFASLSINLWECELGRGGEFGKGFDS